MTKPYNIMSMSAGRSGSASLARAFADREPDIVAYHEHLGAAHHGVLTPDVGLMRRYNSFGYSPEIANFWDRRQKILSNHVANAKAAIYVETAHMLAKAGLIDWLCQADKDIQKNFAFVHLTRDPIKLARSLIERGDIREISGQWLWYLAPEYEKNLVSSEPYIEFNHYGIVCWYVREMEARTNLWKKMLAECSIPVMSIDIDNPYKDQQLNVFMERLGLTEHIKTPLSFPHNNKNESSIEGASVKQIAARQLYEEQATIIFDRVK